MCQSEVVSGDDAKRTIEHLRKRIKELGDKATQLLTFLSFALVVPPYWKLREINLGPVKQCS